MRDRLAAETPDEREARLQQMRDRFAAETPDEREARLQQMRDRLAAETPSEREARLQRMSDCQHDRLATETPDERAARLHHRSQLPLFEQRSVQSKMARFHEHMATLEIASCTTCSEGFPGLQLYSSSTECIRCSRDKHVPQLYSAANNMDPGPVPSQLQVRKYIYIFLYYFCQCTGINSGGRNVDFSSSTHHVTLSASSWAVWLQQTCHQPASRRSLLVAYLAQYSMTLQQNTVLHVHVGTPC